MNSLKQLVLTILGAACLLSANAQEKYQLQYRGSCVSTNEAGDLMKQTVTQNTLMQECVAELGLTNKPKLMLVYHVNADLNGDVIEVIGSRTGQVFCQKLRLLFPITMSSSDGSEVYQLISVFPANGNDPVGQGFVTKKSSRNGKLRISGNLTFYLPPEGTNGLRICTTSFNSSKQVTVTD